MNLPESVTLANARALRDEGIADCKSLAQGAAWQINAASLNAFDSGLLTTLLEWQRMAKVQGVKLTLHGMNHQVAERFKALAASYGVTEVLPTLS